MLDLRWRKWQRAKVNCIMGSCIILNINKYYYDYQISENEMYGAWNVRFDRNTISRRDHLQDLDLCGRVILKCVFKEQGDTMRTYLDLFGSGKGQQYASVNTVMNHWVPWKAGHFLLSWLTTSYITGTWLHLIRWTDNNMSCFCQCSGGVQFKSWL